MADVKYKYAYDENNVPVSIDSLTKETSKQHTYHCIGCGNTLLPRAIGSKSKRAHFYHKEQVECSGETYVHKLAKKLIKQKFDKSEQFLVSYYVNKSCSEINCRLRNTNCRKENAPNEIDLKRFYDTCQEEAQVNGFVADLLLSSSKHPDLDPVLIEIKVTHGCEEEKVNSGLKIIEISVKEEADLLTLINDSNIAESNQRVRINVISFERNIAEILESDISRYTLNLAGKAEDEITLISCKDAEHRLSQDSFCELNICIKPKSNRSDVFLPYIRSWVCSNKHIKHCFFCSRYNCTLGEFQKCYISKDGEDLSVSESNAAENCQRYSLRYRPSLYDISTADYYIEEVSN